MIPVLIALILIGLLVAVLTVGEVTGGDDDRPVAAEGAEASADGDQAEDRDVETAGEPTLRIHPQRARVGSPLELVARGTGCGGRSAVLSIVGLGRATDTSGFDRLVVRRRVDVGDDGNWSSTPLLVGQPVGTYRVTASCDRRAVLDGAEPPDERRDVFTAAEVLELTGPAVLYDVDVAPPTAPPGQALTVRLAGRDHCPSGARVSGTVFPAAGAPGPARPFEAVVDPAGRWSATVTIPARDAEGAYGVEARCSSGFSYVTKSVRFPSPDDPAVVPLEPLTPVGPGSGTRVPAPATPIPGRATYTG